MRSFWAKIITLVIFIVLIGLTLVLIYYVQTDHSPSQNSVFLTNGNEVEVHYSIFVATLALVFIAYIEFERSNKLNTIELLTFISNRWSSKEIIKARQIIHELFVSKYRYDPKNSPENSKEKFKIAMQNTANDIYEMSKKMGDDGKKFVYLLNLLDHFESISYFHKIGQIDLPNIKNIYGNNIIFYYEVLEKYIEQRKLHNPSDFQNFYSMYLTLKPKNQKK